MHMEDPEDPLNLFGDKASTRNSCYEYNVGEDGYVVLSTPPPNMEIPLYPWYPTNTIGYYEVDIVTGINAPTLWYVYQSPMFLMKYFVAVAAGEVDSFTFAELDVADYLENSKWAMISQITDLPFDGSDLGWSATEIWQMLVGNKGRFAYPHYPQSYLILTLYITIGDFN